MAELIAAFIFVAIGSTAGKALARFDRAAFIRTWSLGNSIFVASRIVVVSGVLLWLIFELSGLNRDFAQQREPMMLVMLLSNYMLGMFGLWDRRG